MNGVIITVDTNDALHMKNMQWQGALVSTAPLTHGDLQAVCPDGNKILIERKTPNDFLLSIKDGRLFNQVAGMVESSDFCYVIITGIFMTHDGNDVQYTSNGTWKESNWQWTSLQGALTSIQELGCPVIYDTDYHGAVERIIKRSRSSVKVTPRREAHVFDARENVLMALPNIGSKKAIELIEQFPSLANALVWLTHPDYDIPKIDGIGEKTRENIRRFFGAEIEINNPE